MKNKLMLLVGFVLLISMFLAACQPVVETKEVQVTVKETVVVEVEGEEQIVEVEKVVTATAAEEEPMDEGPRTLVVCQGQQPDQLYIYGGSMLASSHIQEAVYDGPFDTNSFGYQAVIFEKLPSLADGDAVIETVAVNAGDKMVDANGDPAELAEGVVYKPAGCNAAECAVTYEGSDPVEMDQLVVTFKMVSGLMWSDGEPLTAADCYRFVLSNPKTDLCFTGPSTPEQLDENVKALEAGPLTKEEMERVRKIGRHIYGK